MSTSIFKEPILGVVMFGVVPVSLLLTLKQLNSQKGIRLQSMRDCENIDGIVVEQLSGIEYIRVADTLRVESRRLGAALEKRRKFELGHHISMLIYGCGKALNVMSPLNEVHRILDQGHESSLKVADLLQLLNTPVDRSFGSVKLINRPKGEVISGQFLDSSGDFVENGDRGEVPIIQMKNVRAAYQQRHDRRPSALKQISLEIHRGETIGIAGHSGSGKSTCVKLLLRLLHPTEGEILLDGESLGQVNHLDRPSIVDFTRLRSDISFRPWTNCRNRLVS